MVDYREPTCQLIDRLHEKPLIYEFFFVFSRFEYALLSLGYVRPGKTVFADWDKFATNLNDAFKPDLTPRLPEAVKYYEEQPPKMQAVESGRLVWKEGPRQEQQTRLEMLLTSVRRVRNNLFHGEKLGVLLEGDSPRDVKLLEHGLTILCACLNLSTELRNKFYAEAELEEEEEE